MKKHFYHNIVIIDSIHVGLDKLELEPHEKEELLNLVDSNIDHAILDTILSELEKEDKKTFLSLVLTDDHGEIWKMLGTKIQDVETKIKKVANDLIDKFHEDIKEAHSKKK